MLGSGSKDEQNKHSLPASAYEYRVNLPCSNMIAAPQAMSHLQHLGRDHLLNECLQNPRQERGVRA